MGPAGADGHKAVNAKGSLSSVLPKDGQEGQPLTDQDKMAGKAGGVGEDGTDVESSLPPPLLFSDLH